MRVPIRTSCLRSHKCLHKRLSLSLVCSLVYSIECWKTSLSIIVILAANFWEIFTSFSASTKGFTHTHISRERDKVTASNGVATISCRAIFDNFVFITNQCICRGNGTRFWPHPGASGAAGGELLPIFRLRHRQRRARPRPLLLADRGGRGRWWCTHQTPSSLAQWRLVLNFNYFLTVIVIKINFRPRWILSDCYKTFSEFLE